MASENKIFKISRENEYTDPIYLELDLHDKDLRTAFLDIYIHINDNRAFIDRFHPIQILDNLNAESRKKLVSDAVELDSNYIKKRYRNIAQKEINIEREKRIKATLTYVLNTVAYKMVKFDRPLSELEL